MKDSKFKKDPSGSTFPVLALLKKYFSNKNSVCLLFNESEDVLFFSYPGESPGEKNQSQLLGDYIDLLGEELLQFIREKTENPEESFHEKNGNIKEELPFRFFTVFLDGERYYFLEIPSFLVSKGTEEVLRKRNESEISEKLLLYFTRLQKFRDQWEELRKTSNIALKEELLEQLRNDFIPTLRLMEKNIENSPLRFYLNFLAGILEDSVLSPEDSIGRVYELLTPAEMQVAEFIRMGKTSNDIARILDIAKKTVENHRHSLRGKFGLHKTKINLQSYLKKNYKKKS